VQPIEHVTNMYKQPKLYSCTRRIHIRFSVSRVARFSNGITVTQPFRADHRTRIDRTECWHKGFMDQMEGMVDAFMQWSSEVGKRGLHAEVPEPNKECVQGFRCVDVVDAYRKFFFPLPSNTY